MNSNSLITERNLKPLLWLSIAAYLTVIITTAWVCDDAYITLRTVDNFVNGYGLRWNVIERVQSYTHPLWMFVLSGAYVITREPFYTTIFVSVAISAATVLIFAFKLGLTKRQALLGVVLLLFSRAFCDYSTSGLENPLTYLLLSLFLMVYLKDKESSDKRLFYLSLIASLGMTNRLDTALLFLPPLAYALYEERSFKNLKHIMLGMAPVFAWEIFSTIYYGFPFPNTAYAKLLNGVPPLDLAAQGLIYLKYSSYTDPVTVLSIAAAITLPVIRKQKNLLPFSLSIVLYVVYTVKIGGDFMAGRFLTAPFFISCIVITLLTRSIDERRYVFYLGITTLIGLTMLAAFTVKFRVIAFKQYAFHGITEERALQFPHNSLIMRRGDHINEIEIFEEAGIRGKNASNATHLVAKAVGVLGYYGGPRMHVFDVYALPDALLARLPSNYAAEGGPWRIGHFDRKLPDGYMESVVFGKNMLRDPKLALYYEKLRILTAGDIFSAQRFAKIWRFNAKTYDNLIDKDYYAKTPNIPQIRYRILLRLNVQDTPSAK